MEEQERLKATERGLDVLQFFGFGLQRACAGGRHRGLELLSAGADEVGFGGAGQEEEEGHAGNLPGSKVPLNGGWQARRRSAPMQGLAFMQAFCDLARLSGKLVP